MIRALLWRYLGVEALELRLADMERCCGNTRRYVEDLALSNKHLAWQLHALDMNDPEIRAKIDALGGKRVLT